jgi:transposase
LFRTRARLVQQHSELVNALRACLYEYDHAVPQGIHQIKRISEILDAHSSDLPDLTREECAELLDQITPSCDRSKAGYRLAAYSSRIQNCSAFSVSAASPTSFQLNRATTPGRLE